MLYFLHHPAGPVVIRTNNPYIVLQYQHYGWLTTTSWSEVMEDHPEWSPPTTSYTCKTPSLVARILNRLSANLAVLNGYALTGVATTATLLAARKNANEEDTHGEGKEEADEEYSNTGPVHFLTAITRDCYRERGLSTPDEKWIICTDGDEVFDYRLEQGVCELDLVPEYAEEA